MEPIDLNLLRYFVDVRDTLSFSAAAERNGVPRSTVSRAISALESQLGTPLFYRTTRSVSPTSNGDQLFEKLAPRLRALEQVLSERAGEAHALSGPLRITSTPELGRTVLGEVLERYIRRYPGVEVELLLGHQLLDLVRERVDLAIRVASSRWQDSSLIAQRVGTLTLKLYAAETYRLQRGLPRRPDQLGGHVWIAFSGTAALLLRTQNGSWQQPQLKPHIRCDDILGIRSLLLRGVGIGALPSFIGDADVDAGRLLPVLPSWRSISSTIYAVRPHSRQLPRRVGAFTELLQETLRQHSGFDDAAGRRS